MNRKGDDGSGLDDLMGLLIGAVGALCIWLAGLIGGSDGMGWVSNPDGALLWYEGHRWIQADEYESDEVLRSTGGVVVLVHGLDEPGGIWDDVAPALYESGFRVIRFDYPNDQAIRSSAIGMNKAMDRLAHLGIDQASIVAHSMGGLVSREALTNPDLVGSNSSGDQIGGVRILRMILVGTPNEGSAWARLRGVAEARERVQRWLSSDDLDVSILANLGEDGDGQAGVDLLPGSAFLTELNSRPMPDSVPVTCIIGQMVDLSALGSSPTQAMLDGAKAIGDGVVSVDSASLDGCADVVLLNANHRSMLRVMEFEEGWRAMVGAEAGDEPLGIAIILDRLGAGMGAGESGD